VKLDWSAIVGYAISGAIVSWPVFIAGLVIGHRKAARHVENVTGRQTDDIRKMTEEQTRTLQASPSAAYHQRDDSPGAP